MILVLGCNIFVMKNKIQALISITTLKYQKAEKTRLTMVIAQTQSIALNSSTQLI